MLALTPIGHLGYATGFQAWMNNVRFEDTRVHGLRCVDDPPEQSVSHDVCQTYMAGLRPASRSYQMLRNIMAMVKSASSQGLLSYCRTGKDGHKSRNRDLDKLYALCPNSTCSTAIRLVHVSGPHHIQTAVPLPRVHIITSREQLFSTIDGRDAGREAWVA